MRILIDGQTLLTPEINRGIGTYFRNMVENLLSNDFANDFYLNAPAAACSCLSPWTRGKLNLTIQPLDDCRNGSDGARDYTTHINRIIAAENIDLYWSPNPLMTNVFLPGRQIEGCKFAATIYDLIPAVMEAHYRASWPENVFAEYKRKLEVLEADYDLLLHISRHTESDCRKILRIQQKANVVTPLGVNESFCPYPFPTIVSTHDYILYPGGFDPRKNMTRALEAFAHLQHTFGHHEEISSVLFKIVCEVDSKSRVAILSQAQALGVADKVELAGFVADENMIELYQKARCVFFPSLYEGFGLPVLEALACGAPVAASKSSAIPEVAGDLAIYFDPLDVHGMATALHSALREPRDWQARARRHHYAREFSWTRTALMTLAAFADPVQVAVDNPKTNAIFA